VPALKRPTISTQAIPNGWRSTLLIEENTAWDVIPRLKESQGAGIVEYPLNKVVL